MIFRSFLYNYAPRFLVSKFVSKNKDCFGFLIHLGDIKDIKKKYPAFKILPDKILFFLLNFLPPLIMSEIKGKDKLKNLLHGYIILCPITAKQMLDDRVLACKKIQRALKLAEKISLKIIGLGAYTSSVTDGGRDIVGKYKLAITNGNACTSAVAIKDIAKIVKCVFKGNFSEPEIAVVGATGSIGSAVSKMIAAYKPRSLILVGRNAENLNELKSDIKSFQKIFATTKIQNIKTADLIVVATSAKGAILKPDYLKKGAIVYDITQPRNVAKILCEQRPDILVLDGGLVKTENISYQFNFYLPKDTIFACLAEVMILTLKKQFIDFSIGKVSLDKVEKINKMVQDIGFESPAFYSFGKRVSLRR